MELMGIASLVIFVIVFICALYESRGGRPR